MVSEIFGVGVCVGGWTVCVFQNAAKRGHTLVNEQANMNAHPDSGCLRSRFPVLSRSSQIASIFFF